MRSVNTSTVRDPKWTGVDGEYAIVVSRGEPRRTDEEMRAAVLVQIGRYQRDHADHGRAAIGRALTYGEARRAADLIAADYINGPGMQGVALTREHLFKYLVIAGRQS